MPSRKKDKGRERREKKAKAACTHGFSDMPGGRWRAFGDIFRRVWGKKIVEHDAKNADVHPYLRVSNAAVEAMVCAIGVDPEAFAPNRDGIISELLGSYGVDCLLAKEKENGVLFHCDDGDGERLAGGIKQRPS